MNKLEKFLFSELTNQSEFYIKDYHSKFLNDNKWIAIMENKDFIYAVVVCKSSESNFIYSEVIHFLENLYLKKVSLNIVVYGEENYEELIQQPYNKLIYSEKEKQVVYSDNSCKPLVSILNHSLEKEKSNDFKVKYKECFVTYILICINILIFIITVFSSTFIGSLSPQAETRQHAKIAKIDAKSVKNFFISTSKIKNCAHKNGHKNNTLPNFSTAQEKVTIISTGRQSDFDRNDCCDGFSPHFPYFQQEILLLALND